MGIGFIIVGIVCLLYYIWMALAGMDFSIIWLCGAVFLIGGGCLSQYVKAHNRRFPVIVKAGGGVILAAVFLVFLIILGMIVSGMFEKGEKNLDYVIVLGAQVRGRTPSRALNQRIKKAAEYLEENPETMAILSGGQGPDEHISEAQAMFERLQKMGIASERLIMEDKSTTTEENLKFSAALIGEKDVKIGLVSQNFHIFRAVGLAKHMGYHNICGIAAPAEWVYQPHYLLRECFALVKEKLVGNL